MAVAHEARQQMAADKTGATEDEQVLWFHANRLPAEVIVK